MKKSMFILITVFALFALAAPALAGTANISATSYKAGDVVTIEGAIAPGQDLYIAIAQQNMHLVGPMVGHGHIVPAIAVEVAQSQRDRTPPDRHLSAVREGSRSVSQQYTHALMIVVGKDQVLVGVVVKVPGQDEASPSRREVARLKETSVRRVFGCQA